MKAENPTLFKSKGPRQFTWFSSTGIYRTRRSSHFMNKKGVDGYLQINHRGSGGDSNLRIGNLGFRLVRNK